VLLAMGFVHPVHEGLLKTLGVDLDQRDKLTIRPHAQTEFTAVSDKLKWL